MDTGHWLTVVFTLVAALLSIGQTVFWFEVRSLHRRIDRAEERISDVAHSLETCRYSHDSLAATKADVAEVKGAVASLHRRIDQLYNLLLSRTGGEE
jgi:HAMP domain-containing protein